MPVCRTLGTPGRAVRFEYTGNVKQGVEIIYDSCTVKVSGSFFDHVLTQFRGKKVAGGFCVTNTPVNGFGNWIKQNSRRNSQDLNPGNGSRVAAILVHEKYATSNRIGNAVFLTFNSSPKRRAYAGKRTINTAVERPRTSP